MDLARLGVFAFLDGFSAAEADRFAEALERWGYGTLWIVEAAGRDSLVHAARLLARTERLVVGTGVASVWSREATQIAAAARTNAELSAGRFILGLGVNNPWTAQVRGFDYSKPLSRMREVLARIPGALHAAPAPPSEPPIVLAALNQRMLELAATAAQGVLSYLVPPEYTARARAVMGPQKWVCAEQAVLLETDPAKARAAARNYMQAYLPAIETYVRCLRSFGFEDADFEDGLSDRLVDAVVAWGSEADIRRRLDDHRAAGASHVCVLPLSPNGGLVPDLRVLEVLAPGA